MIVAIIFAQVWCVIQLVVLGSFERTVRVRTVFAAMAVGLYACAPLTVLLQLAWIKPAAWLTGASVHSLTQTAAYTVGPFLEQIVEVLPLLALLAIPVVRRQWSVTDTVVVATALSSGFRLAEFLYLFGASPKQAYATDIGWNLAASMALPRVPGFWTTLGSWLPDGAAASDLVAPGGHALNAPVAWGALCGLAVGLAFLQRTVFARVSAFFLLLYVGIDHAAFNATAFLGSTWLAGAAMPLRAVHDWLWCMPLAALAAAWWLDQRQPLPRRDELSLASERSASFRPLGTLQAFFGRPPWSLLWVWEFVRTRRVYDRTRGLEDQESQRLRIAMAGLRDGIDRVLASPNPSFRLARDWARRVLGKLSRPKTVLWLMLMAPSIAWFIVGGWPQTSFVQEAVQGPVAWKGVLAVSAASFVWCALQVTAAVRMRSRLARLPLADASANVALRVMCGVGALGFVGYGLWRGFAGLPPGLRVLEASAVEAGQSLTLGSALPLGSAAAAGLPPDLFSSEAFQEGYQQGSAGHSRDYPRNASPEYVAAYDVGYRMSLGSDPNAEPQESGIRPPRPGEEILSRSIPVLSDNGVGYHMELITGTESYLDAREGVERGKITDSVFSGFGSAAKGVQGQTAPSWVPKGALGTSPAGTKTVGASVAEDDARTGTEESKAGTKRPPD